MIAILNSRQPLKYKEKATYNVRATTAAGTFNRNILK